MKFYFLFIVVHAVGCGCEKITLKQNGPFQGTRAFNVKRLSDRADCNPGWGKTTEYWLRYVTIEWVKMILRTLTSYCGMVSLVKTTEYLQMKSSIIKKMRTITFHVLTLY